MTELCTDSLATRLEEISLIATRCRSHAKLAQGDTYSLCDLIVELAELHEAVLRAIRDVGQVIDPAGAEKFLGLADGARRG